MFQFSFLSLRSPIAKKWHNSKFSAASYYVYPDHQGTVRALTDAVVNEYSYGGRKRRSRLCLSRAASPAVKEIIVRRRPWTYCL